MGRGVGGSGIRRVCEQYLLIEILSSVVPPGAPASAGEFGFRLRRDGKLAEPSAALAFIKLAGINLADEIYNTYIERRRAFSQLP